MAKKKAKKAMPPWMAKYAKGDAADAAKPAAKKKSKKK